MKEKIKELVGLLAAISINALFASNAQAFITMPEREHAQTIVWIVEIVTFVTAFAIALLVWKVSKRDKNAKNRNSGVNQDK